jgi:hypothetical protein
MSDLYLDKLGQTMDHLACHQIYSFHSDHCIELDYSSHKQTDPMPVQFLAMQQSYPPARTCPIQVLPTAVKAVVVDGHYSRVVSFPDLDLELA